MHRTDRLHLSAFEIIEKYGAEFRGIVQFYQHTHNAAEQLGKIYYAMEVSLAKTLAAKLKTCTYSVYKQYKFQGTRNGMRITVKGRTATFGGFTLKRRRKWTKMVDTQSTFLHYYGRSELVRRLNKGQCEIPKCPNPGEEVHHIRKLADLKQKYAKQGKKAPAWVIEMVGRNRKTLVLCKTHHYEIHRGKYDGTKLKDLG